MAGQGRILTALLARHATGYIEVDLLIVNSRTHRLAYTGPLGEAGFGTDPGGGATHWIMPDGRDAWYFPGLNIDPGNVEGLANYQAALAFGRIEGHLSLGQMPDPNQVSFIAHGMLGDYCTPMVSRVAGVEPNLADQSDVPYDAFGPADWIWSSDDTAPITYIGLGSDGAVLPQATIHVLDNSEYPIGGVIVINGTQVAYTGTTGTAFTGCTGGLGKMHLGDPVALVSAARVENLSVQEDAEGFVSYTAELDTLAQENDVRFQRWLSRMSHGTLGGNIESAAPPPPPPPPAAQPADEVIPFNMPGPNPVVVAESDDKNASRSGTLYKVTASLTIVGSTDTTVEVIFNAPAAAIATLTIPAGSLNATPVLLNQAVRGAMTAGATSPPDRIRVSVTAAGTDAVGLVVDVSIK